MILNRTSIAYIVFLTFLGLNVVGQEEVRYQQQIIARATPDSVLLRWAPTNYDTWQTGIQNGYSIERFTMYENGALLPPAMRQRKLIGPVIPWVQQKWEPLMDVDDYASIAAEAMYGESFDLKSSEESPALSFFNAATEQQNRYSFALFAADMSVNAAEASGLFYKDTDVKMGEKYLYRIVVQHYDTIPADTAYVFTGPDEYYPLSKPNILEIQPDDRMAMITWHRSPGRQEYSAFFIERSDDLGKSFHPLNRIPLVNTSETVNKLEFNYFIDTLPENNSTYTYRVQGITPFGEKGPYSDTLSTMGIDKVKALPHITGYRAEGPTVVIEWNFLEKETKKIKGFQVMRSTNVRDGFESVSGLLNKNTRTFTDISPLPTAYYKIKVVDKHDRGNSSLAVLMQLPDTIPPAAPEGLKATIDTAGNVILSWKSNSEEDIYGYRVYRANAEHEEFSQITVSPGRDTVFFDKISLKTLTKSIFYKVMATDLRQNYSELSLALEAERPDTIPPSSPVINEIYVSDSGICLKWTNSSSSDVTGNILLRRRKDSSEWKQLEVLSAEKSNYCDNLVTPGISYSYALAAFDKSGNTSKIVNPMSAKTSYSSCLKINNLSYQVQREEGKISLNWEKPSCAERYIIYRGTANKPLKTYKAIQGKEISSFEDLQLTPDSQYQYAVKAISETGIAGTLSTINVNY